MGTCWHLLDLGALSMLLLMLIRKQSHVTSLFLCWPIRMLLYMVTKTTYPIILLLYLIRWIPLRYISNIFIVFYVFINLWLGSIHIWYVRLFMQKPMLQFLWWKYWTYIYFAYTKLHIFISEKSCMIIKNINFKIFKSTIHYWYVIYFIKLFYFSVYSNVYM